MCNQALDFDVIVIYCDQHAYIIHACGLIGFGQVNRAAELKALEDMELQMQKLMKLKQLQELHTKMKQFQQAAMITQQCRTPPVLNGTCSIEALINKVCKIL